MIACFINCILLRVAFQLFTVCRKYTNWIGYYVILSHVLGLSVSYQVARFVTDILSPIVGKSPHHIKTTQDFVIRLIILWWAVAKFWFPMTHLLCSRIFLFTVHWKSLNICWKNITAGNRGLFKCQSNHVIAWVLFAYKCAHSVATNSGLLHKESANKPLRRLLLILPEARPLQHFHTFKVSRRHYAERKKRVLSYVLSRIKLSPVCWYLPRISLILNRSQELYILHPLWGLRLKT